MSYQGWSQEVGSVRKEEVWDKASMRGRRMEGEEWAK
jgi:hypothetical protein